MRLKGGMSDAQTGALEADEVGNNQESFDPDDVVLEGAPSAVRQALEQSDAAHHLGRTRRSALKRRK